MHISKTRYLQFFSETADMEWIILRYMQNLVQLTEE